MYDSLKLRIEELLQKGIQEGDGLRYLEKLPGMLLVLPDEESRKKLIRETVLVEYYEKEKAMGFDDQDVYEVLMMIRIGQKMHVRE